MNKTSIYYNGIYGLLKSNIVLDLEEWHIREIYKCKKDINYFLSNYVKIVNQELGEINFVPYEHQKIAIKEVQEHKRNIWCWTRQGFKTQTAVGLMLHYAIFNSNKGIAILANKGMAAKEVLNRFQFSYSRLPEWLQVGATSWQKSSVTLGNGSEIIAANTSADSIRGKSISFLYIDECAFVENWDVFWSATYPVISSNPNSIVLLTSTPNSLNHFYKLVQDSKKNRLNFKVNEVVWSQIPGRNQEWADRALKDLGGDINKFEQEYNLGWMGNSNTLIDMKTLKNLVYLDPIEIKYNNKFKIYEYPIPDAQYYLLCDYSEGIGQDYSTIQIFKKNLDKFTQVATFKDNKIKLREMASLKVLIAKYFNEALIIGESNFIGKFSLLEAFEEHEYENIFFDLEEKNNIGLRTTKKTKRLGCSYLKKYVENNKFEIVDFDTINELSTFISKKESYEADTGKHDDLIIPMVLFSHLLNNETFIDWYVDDYDMRSADIKVEKEDILPFYLFGDVDSDEGWIEMK